MSFDFRRRWGDRVRTLQPENLFSAEVEFYSALESRI